MEEQKAEATKALFGQAQNKIIIFPETECYKKIIEKIEGLLKEGIFLFDGGSYEPSYYEFGIQAVQNYSVCIGRHEYDCGIWEFSCMSYLKTPGLDVFKLIEDIKSYFINKYSLVNVTNISTFEHLIISIDIKIIDN